MLLEFFYGLFNRLVYVAGNSLLVVSLRLDAVDLIPELSEIFVLFDQGEDYARVLREGDQTDPVLRLQTPVENLLKYFFDFMHSSLIAIDKKDNILVPVLEGVKHLPQASALLPILSHY